MNEEKEEIQKRGYMCEHLLSFYSMTSDKAALYDGNFPVYFGNHGEADAILFGLRDENADRSTCVQELLKLPIKELNTISPEALTDFSDIETRYVDWDYHINLDRFDLSMKGKEYKSIRYSTHRADDMRYRINFGHELTRSHIYVLSRHMASHTLNIWDFEELLSLEQFLREERHGFLMEAYQGDELVGSDVIGVKDKDLSFLTMSKNGYGKKTNLKSYRLQRRAGSGIKTSKITDKTGVLTSAKIIQPESEEMIVLSSKGQAIRLSISEVPETGRQTQGVRIMHVASGDSIASVTCL